MPLTLSSAGQTASREALGGLGKDSGTHLSSLAPKTASALQRSGQAETSKAKRLVHHRAVARPVWGVPPCRWHAP